MIFQMKFVERGVLRVRVVRKSEFGSDQKK